MHFSSKFFNKLNLYNLFLVNKMYLYEIDNNVILGSVLLNFSGNHFYQMLKLNLV